MLAASEDVEMVRSDAPVSNVIDRDLAAIKKIADALTPLGIDVIVVNNLYSVEHTTPGSEAARIPPVVIRYTTADLTVRVPFAEDPANPESSDTSQGHDSR